MLATACGPSATPTAPALDLARSAEATGTAAADATGVPVVDDGAAADAVGDAVELDVAVVRDLHPDVGSLVFRLLGMPAAADGDLSTVTAIEIRDGDLPAVRQVLGPLEARVRLDPHAGAMDAFGGFYVEDFDFDGIPDLRLERDGSEEANTPFLYWRYDPTAGRYVADRTLEPITAPEVDAAARVIRSRWSDGPDRSGVDTWDWEANAPVLRAREEYALTAEGESVTRIYVRDGATGELVLVDEIVAGEAPEE